MRIRRDSIESSLLVGCVEGTRGCVKPSVGWLVSITMWTEVCQELVYNDQYKTEGNGLANCHKATIVHDMT